MLTVDVGPDFHRLNFDFAIDPSKVNIAEKVVGVEKIAHAGRYYIVLVLADLFDTITVIEDVARIFTPEPEIFGGEPLDDQCPNDCGRVHKTSYGTICWHCGWRRINVNPHRRNPHG